MKHLLLLHGALGSAEQVAPLQEALQNDFNVHAPSFSGHGGVPFGDAFGIEAFARETFGFLNRNNIEKTDVFGYSMGGYVALYLATLAPERLGRIVTLATKFDWTPDSAAKEVKMLDPEKIEAKVPAFAEMLAQRHAPNNWKEVLRQTAAMMLDLGNRPPLAAGVLGKITHPVLVCLGDSDQMISQEETRQAAQALPNGKLLILEQTPHPFEKMDVAKVEVVVRTFCG